MTVILQDTRPRWFSKRPIPFANETPAIRKKLYKLFNDSLVFNSIDSFTISYVVPAKSTALIWPGLSTAGLFSLKVIIRQNEFADTVSINDLQKLKGKSNTVKYYDFLK